MNRINTLFQLASMSKPVSAYAALKEVELGKLNPNVDVNFYLINPKNEKVSKILETLSDECNELIFC